MIVDLRSDTVTRPCQAMYDAMMSAPLGDDVLGDDPTVRALEAEAIALSGMEAAVYVPSGTMGNQIAIAMHTRPGDAVLMEDGGHPYNYESGGAAVISGVQIRPLVGVNGLLDPTVVDAAQPPYDAHFSPIGLLIVENTANRGGGTVYPVSQLDALTNVAKKHGWKVHMDGARVFNAVVASDTPLSRVVRDFDSVTFCLSKGLGAPIGSVLCGSEGAIARGRFVRKRLGGGMRQAGIIAAAGLFSLQNNIGRLADDHRRAKILAAGIAAAGFSADIPETNMVYVDVDDGPAWQNRLEEKGIRCYAVSDTRLRLVVHLDVDDAGIEAAISGFQPG